MKEISIVIPSINRQGDLKNTVKYIISQNFQDFEVIIIDQSSEDLFADLSSVDDRVVHIHRSDFTSASRARNLGIQLAKYDIILFLDDDVILNNKEYLMNISTEFTKEHAVGVTGPIIEFGIGKVSETRHKWSFNPSWGWLFFPRNYSKKCSINDAGAGNLAVLKKNAIKIGGMDCQFDKGAHREESDFNMRYTKLFGWYSFVPDCSLIHIGRRKGGVRSWNEHRKDSVKAQHHFDGAMYFLMKNVKWYHWIPHLLSTGMYFFYKKQFVRRPDLFIISFIRLLKGVRNAFHMQRIGPRYINK